MVIVGPIGAKGTAGHEIPVPAVVQKHRIVFHQQDDAVFIRMAVVHFFFLNRNGGAQVFPEKPAAVAFIAVIVEQIGAVFVPAIPEHDFLADDVVQNLLASRLRRVRRQRKIGPAIRI